MKGILNLLAKAKLIELSEDEQLAAAGEASPAGPNASHELSGDLSGDLSGHQPQRESGIETAVAPSAGGADASPELEGQAFADIFASAGVPASPYPAEKLLRLLDGLRAMDASTRKAAVLAMDAADDNWQISDCVGDAELKIAALDDYKRQLTAQMEDRESRSAELLTQIKAALDEATVAIRKQIAELEQLREREVTRVAQEATGVEAGLRAARESAARETRRVDAEIERLREILTTFKAPGAAY